MKDMAKKRKGRPKVDALPLTLRLPPHLVAPLDAFIATQSFPPSRAEAIRRLLSDGLTGLGFIRHREDPEGAN